MNSSCKVVSCVQSKSVAAGFRGIYACKHFYFDTKVYQGNIPRARTDPFFCVDHSRFWLYLKSNRNRGSSDQQHFQPLLFSLVRLSPAGFLTGVAPGVIFCSFTFFGRKRFEGKPFLKCIVRFRLSMWCFSSILQWNCRAKTAGVTILMQR